MEILSFFDKVKNVGNYYNGDDYGYDKRVKNIDNWETAYNKANELEESSINNTFLFSAQHKDCIILATILTAFFKSDTIIWRPDVGESGVEELDKNEHQLHENTINMSASISLFDWSTTESANFFLIMNQLANSTSTGACKNLLYNFLQDKKKLLDKNKIKKIIQKYYDKLEKRYLCVFEFNDDQLEKYSRLSLPWGEKIKNENTTKDIKTKITAIKKLYSDNCGVDPNSDKCHNYINSEKKKTDKNIGNQQSRVLSTRPEDNDRYVSYILEPDTNDAYSKMKAEIIDAMTPKKKFKFNFKLPWTKGGSKKSKRKQFKSKKTKRIYLSI